jgi:hypothetical protein
VRPAGTIDSSAVLVLPNIKVKMEAQHFIPPSELSSVIKGKLYFLLY